MKSKEKDEEYGLISQMALTDINVLVNSVPPSFWQGTIGEEVVGSIINALLGLFVLIEGLSFLPPDTARTLGIIFFVFAAVDFYLPYSLKQRWLANNPGKQEQGSDPVQRP